MNPLATKALIAFCIFLKSATSVLEFMNSVANDVLDSNHAYIDPSKKSIIIKCNTEGIPHELFKITSLYKNTHAHIYITAFPNEAPNPIDIEYKIYNIPSSDLDNMFWSTTNDILTITIPLSTVKKELSIKRVRKDDK